MKEPPVVFECCREEKGVGHKRSSISSDALASLRGSPKSCCQWLVRGQFLPLGNTR